jgi:hypothetical protein
MGWTGAVVKRIRSVDLGGGGADPMRGHERRSRLGYGGGGRR